jgi:outer membrane protein TolC
MRYLKSAAFLLLTVSSSLSVLSRLAIAAEDPALTGSLNEIQPEPDDSAAADEVTHPVAEEAPTAPVETGYIKQIDLSSLLNGAQGESSAELLLNSRSFAEPPPRFSVRSQPAAQPTAQPTDRELRGQPLQAQAPSPENSPENLPVLEEANPAEPTPTAEPAPTIDTPPPTAPPVTPPATDTPPAAPPESPPTEAESAPADESTPSPTAASEINELPDILFADPNPLSVPTSPEEVDLDKNPVVTLEQAIELAYRNSQSLQVALLTLEQAGAAVDEARAAYLPTATTDATITSQEGRLSGLDTAVSGSVDLSYDVITGGSRVAAVRAAELQQQTSALAVEAQQEQIRLTTATAYYALQEAGEQIRINQSFLDEAERNLRDSRLRQEVGVGTRFDVLRAEVQFANARQSLIQSQSQQQIARRDIARLLNLPPTAGLEATPVAVGETWPLTLEESIVLAFQNRAELEQQLLQADISEQQRRIALAAVRPRVSVFANYSTQALLEGGSGFEDNYSFGARFNMTLFDGGAANASARQREIDGQIAEEQFSENLDQVRFDVEEAYANLQANQENIATSQIAVSQAEEALSLANLRLQAGVGTQLDVLTAQRDLTEAQGNNVTAILGYNRALAAIQRAVSNVEVEL